MQHVYVPHRAADHGPAPSSFVIRCHAAIRSLLGLTLILVLLESPNLARNYLEDVLGAEPNTYTLGDLIRWRGAVEAGDRTRAQRIAIGTRVRR